MTKQDYWTIVEDYDRHKALQEVERIPSNINRTGDYYKYLLRDIERRYNVTL